MVKAMIKAIVFDVGEVLLNGFWGIQFRLEPLLGIKADKIFWMLEGEELSSLFKGEITEEEYWKRILRKNKWNIDMKILKKSARDNFREIDGMREIVEKLKYGGFKLGLVSDHAKEWIDHCKEKYGYHKLFHSSLYSFEVGVRKPSKRIYELILDKLKIKPEECLYVDDQERNIKSAGEIGIKTILFKNSEELKRDLIGFGIEI